MTTITNTTGSKAVNMMTEADGMVRAFYVQGDQVLQAKSYTTIKRAEKWARKVLA